MDYHINKSNCLIDYLNDGTGKDCPRHKIDKDWLHLTSTSWRRPPDILGATLPTGSEVLIKRNSFG